MGMNNATAIINAFGGLTKAATAIGAPISTVQHWRDTNRIPPWREEQVMNAVRREGVSLPATGSPS